MALCGAVLNSLKWKHTITGTTDEECTESEAKSIFAKSRVVETEHRRARRRVRCDRWMAKRGLMGHDGRGDARVTTLAGFPFLLH